MPSGVRHLCFQNGWATCTVCDGRLHQDGCTSKRNKKKDCCKARHKNLNAQGISHGIFDASRPMFDEKDPTWAGE